MRAKLETGRRSPKPARCRCCPTCARSRRSEFTFVAPANPANGLYPPDTVNPPLDVAGRPSVRARPTRWRRSTVQGGGGDARCLRFTSGPMNVGDGPYEMHFTYAPDIVNGVDPVADRPRPDDADHPLRPTASTTTRPAGTYSFHVMHGHFHDDGILDLGAVPGERRRTLTTRRRRHEVRLLPGQPAVRRLAHVRPDAARRRDRRGDAGAGNCQSFSDGVLGLSPGWGDVYRWQRPGQYVEFGQLGDGRYVVRATVDPENHDPRVERQEQLRLRAHQGRRATRST